MKFKKLISVVSLTLCASSLFATNGDHLIGLGPKSRALGGAGIAYSLGAESALVNPALIEGRRVMFGGSYFGPNVEFKNNVDTSSVGGGNSGAEFESSNKLGSLIPEVAISYQIDEDTAWGVGMFGIAGMGVDYNKDKPFYGNPFIIGEPNPTVPQNEYIGTKNGTNQLTTNLQILKFAVPYAVKLNNKLRIGIVPVLQYGALGMSFNGGAYNLDGNGKAQNLIMGTGTSEDVAIGGEFGLGYNVEPFDVKNRAISNLSFGLVVKTPIKMTYEHQLTAMTKAFGLRGFSDDLTQPGEIGIGTAYRLSANDTIMFDYKMIFWGEAEGYKDFGWENQDVFAVGYEMIESDSDWVWRAGYNYAKTPFSELGTGSAFDANGFNYRNYKNSVLNYFNLAGFPAVTEHHFSVGAGKKINKHTSLDFAMVYSPTEEKEFDTSALLQAQTAGMAGEMLPGIQSGLSGVKSYSSVHHNQFSFTIGFNINYN